MPTYGYRCENGHEFEVFQSISDDPLTACEICAKPVRRIFYPVGIVFKGPGFYKTDSRGSSSSGTPAASTSAEKSDSAKGEPKTEPKTESKPAVKKPEKKSA